MTFGDGSELFAPTHQGQRSWRERLTPKQTEWLEWVASQVEETKRLPSWKKVEESWRTNFPEVEPPSQKTFSRHITDVLKESGRGEWL